MIPLWLHVFSMGLTNVWQRSSRNPAPNVCFSMASSWACGHHKAPQCPRDLAVNSYPQWTHIFLPEVPHLLRD